MARICLITTGQPSSNPRIVKEADALSEAGYRVRVICAHWAAWADAADREWLGSRSWNCSYVGGRPSADRGPYWRSRLRHSVAKRTERFLGERDRADSVTLAALSRVTPELISAAKAEKSDLYIAHNVGALPAAVIAARHHRALAGFDAEDLHCDEAVSDPGSEPRRSTIARVEAEFIPRCDHVSASSPGISDSYAARYGIATPLTLLNAFPLRQQPALRRSDRTGTLRLYWFSQMIGANRGLEDVVRAMGRLAEADLELHLRGTWQPGYRERLLGLARASGVKESAIVAHPPGLPDEMPRMAACFDVGLSPEQPLSRNKDLCLGNKIFTYFLAGNAIVATDTLAQSQLLKGSGPAARLYQPGDIEALSELFRSLLRDRRGLEHARKCAWQAGRDVYNWDREKPKLLDRIESVLRR